MVVPAWLNPAVRHANIVPIRHCPLCARTLSADADETHPRCDGCDILLETEFTDKTLCRCGKYHNTPSEQDPDYCRLCMGEEVPTGVPKGELVRVIDQEDDDNEL